MPAQRDVTIPLATIFKIPLIESRSNTWYNDRKQEVGRMDAFTMWQEKIVYKKGWFIHMDGNGNNSIISHQRARELELGYQRYQARMDIDRGGAPDDVAYPNRGFTPKNGGYDYERFLVDRMITGKLAPIQQCLVIPETIDSIAINCIASQAFQGNTSIHTVILHDGIKEIGTSAFQGCSNLKQITISNDHIIIKTDAFKDTAIIEQDTVYVKNTLMKVSPHHTGVLMIKAGTTAIADGALKECKQISEIVLPESLISIGNDSFRGCSSIRSIELPGSLCTIGDHAFQNCTSLANIRFPHRMDRIGMAAFNGCVSLTEISLPEGITEIKRATFYKCQNLVEVHIPKSVTTIWSNAFTDCGLFKAYMSSPDKELYIDDWLIHYKWDEIETLKIRQGTVGIAGMDWANPTKLTTLELPRTLKYIGYEAFTHAPITSLKLPSDLQRIDTGAFRDTNLKNIVIPRSVTKIDKWAFMDCEDIERITIKGENTEIIWPAITGRRDKKPIYISAPKRSKAHGYCMNYGDKNHLIFQRTF